MFPVLSLLSRTHYEAGLSWITSKKPRWRQSWHGGSYSQDVLPMHISKPHGKGQAQGKAHRHCWRQDTPVSSREASTWVDLLVDCSVEGEGHILQGQNRLEEMLKKLTALRTKWVPTSGNSSVNATSTGHSPQAQNAGAEQLSHQGKWHFNMILYKLMSMQKKSWWAQYQ